MGSENLYAVETARRVLSALAAKHDPDPSDLDELRRLAPPLAQLPADELATNVMRLAQTIAATTDGGRPPSTNIPAGGLGRCGLRRTRRAKGANQVSRPAGERRK